MYINDTAYMIVHIKIIYICYWILWWFIKDRIYGHFAENIYKLINENKNQQQEEVYIFLLVIIDAVTHVFLQVEIDD